MTVQMQEAPEWTTVPVEVPPTRKIVAAAVGVALAGDVAVRAGFVGLAGALFLASMSVALLATGRLRTPSARALAAAAPLFGDWLAVRRMGGLEPRPLAGGRGAGAPLRGIGQTPRRL